MSKAEQIADRVDVGKATNAGKCYRGLVPAGQLQRLAELALAVNEPAEAIATFKRDSSGHWLLDVEVAGQVEMQCQRCLQAVAVDVQAQAALQLVIDDTAAKQVLAEREPAEMDADGEILLHQVIEDELILNLPIVAQHEDCAAPDFENPELPDDEPAQAEKLNPFAILKDWQKH